MRDPQESDADWLRSFEMDHSRLVVRLLEGPLATTPHEVWEATIELPHSDSYAFSTLGRLTEALRAERLGTADFSIQERRTYTSWGASGAGQSILLDVASWIVSASAVGVLGATVYDVLKSTVLSVVREGRARLPTRPVDREEAQSRARWHLISHFDLEVDEDRQRSSLELVGEWHLSDGSWVLHFVDGGIRYEVELVGEGGLATVGRIGWSKAMTD